LQYSLQKRIPMERIDFVPSSEYGSGFISATAKYIIVAFL